MTDFVSSLKKTRKTASDILVAALSHSDGKTEKEIRDTILETVAAHDELFPMGWYDPPPGGVAVLSSSSPYRRLQFDTLREEDYWPGSDGVIGGENVSLVYISPVDRKTGMFGDIGLTLYTGSDPAIREHIRSCRDLLIQAAETARAGMKFSDLYRSSIESFQNQGGKVIGWMTTYHDPLKVNLGHTVPGSYSEPVLAETFEETKEAIRSRRIYINEVESFEIPETCAFTMEVRLTDAEKRLPNTFFHVIVSFSSGRKEILTDFDDIFRTVGMEYMI